MTGFCLPPWAPGSDRMSGICLSFIKYFLRGLKVTYYIIVAFYDFMA